MTKLIKVAQGTNAIARNRNKNERGCFALKIKMGKSAQILELPDLSALYLDVAEPLEEP